MWSRSAAVSETTFAKSDILLEVRFEATFRVPLPMYRWIVWVSTCQVEVCSSRVIHTTEQELFPSTSMIFFFLMRVWLLGKHFRMVSEQRRFFQLMIWQAFSYREKATCSVVATHCMTKHDLMKFSQRSLLLLLPGLLLRPRLWLQTLYRSRTPFCSAQVNVK